MKIFIDTTPLVNGHQGRGIGIYTKNLVKALKKIPTIGVTTGDSSQGGYECDLIHYPYFDFFFHTLPILKKTKTVVTIHDTIPLIYQQQVRPGIKGLLRLQLQKVALGNVDGIITDSNNSRSDITRDLRIDPQKVYAVPLAVDEDFRKVLRTSKATPKAINHLPKKYLLYVGDINFNKNINQLLNAFEAVSDQTLSLVIVSRALNNKHIPEAKQIITTISHSSKRGKIQLLTNVESSMLPHIYKSALAYIQPSLYEGFGLPLLEAFEAGIPVLSSFSSSLPEVGGEAVKYFDPENTQSITSAIENLLALNATQRQEIITKGKQQVEKFTWEQTAKMTAHVYKKVLSL